MGKLSFVLLGGDFSHKPVRWALIRFLVVSALSGAALGFFYGVGEHGENRLLTAAFAAAFAIYYVIEAANVWRLSDELTRMVMVRALAFAGAFSLGASFIYAIGEFAFGWPRPPMVYVAASIGVVHFISWVGAALRV